ncbi:hypothetical protein GLOIN_2v1765777 [Rhizophagus irregularis DAOM 181602=DAOM 197198]|nr:hypothetical protein GLOIN_2v1765777 [Rhizophagus irregularis DAOM 181602=DAOM 197198]
MHCRNNRTVQIPRIGMEAWIVKLLAHFRTVSRLGVELLGNWIKTRAIFSKTAEIKSKNLQEHTIKVVKFHKNIAEDLTTVDRKRKESPLDEDVEQEYDAKTTSAENFKKPNLHLMEIEKVNQLEKVDGKILSIIRLGLSSIIDLSSEFDKGMCTWVGENWEDLKMKVSKNINFEVKKLEGDTLSDVIKMEKLCASYHYWEARAYLLDKLKERPIDDKHRQVLKIYYHLIDMLLENPCTFVNKEGGKKNLTEIEYIMKYLKWGETVSKSTLNRKIDLRVLTAKDDIELSHSEFARKATPVKIIKDRSKCLRTNKCILDTYLLRNLPEEAVEDFIFYGIQSAGLEGQLFAIDLVDDGLYFNLDGPTYRFPAQLCDINTLRNTLEVLYFFKDNAINKAKYLSCDDGNSIAKILHSRAITTKSKHHKINYIKKTYFTPKKAISSEIKALCSRECTLRGEK